MNDHEPTTAEWLKLREYLEGSLAFRRRVQRERKEKGLHNDWIDQRIDDDIKMNCLSLSFIDQLLESRAEANII